MKSTLRSAATELEPSEHTPIPGVFVAYSPDRGIDDAVCLEIKPPMIVGRSPDSGLRVSDPTLSSQHCSFFKITDNHYVRDLGSTNGTFVDGEMIHGGEELYNGTVIRAGESLFVYCDDLTPYLEPPGRTFPFLAGRIHTPLILRSLRKAIDGRQPILVEGPSGAGKELALRALVALRNAPNTPVVIHNAACFASEDEAMTTLFGVGGRVFSNVDERMGLIERADGGILFLDEAHGLPPRVQRALLRVIEDGELNRIGADKRGRRVNVTFVFASNEPGPMHGFAHDMLARMQIVHMPSLADRVADIPEIFRRVLADELIRLGIEPTPVLHALIAVHYEALCLDGFRDRNVRGLIGFAARLASDVRDGIDPRRAFAEALRARKSERFASARRKAPTGEYVRFATQPAPSPQEFSRGNDDEQSDESAIAESREEAFKIWLASRGNISETQRLLASKGIVTTRKTLRKYFSEWGFPSREDLRQRA